MRSRRTFPFLLLILFFHLIVPRLSQSAGPDPADCSSPENLLVIRLYFPSPEDLKAIAAQYDIWESHRDQGFVVIGTRCGELEKITGQGWTVEIESAKTWETRSSLLGVPQFPCYRSVEETFAVLQNLAAGYPTLTDLIDMGDSWDKITPGGPAGFDLQALRITNKNIPGPKPVFFLMAAIHGRELTTSETALRLAETLLQQYGVNPEITLLLDYQEIQVVPLMNPDGRKWAEQGYLWRKNTDSLGSCTFPYYGVDLNRNHSFHWGGAGASPCDELYQGPAAASEPETQALQDHVRLLFPDRRGLLESDPAPADTAGIFITLHSYGGLVLWPWGWSDLIQAPNDAQLQAIGAKLASLNHYTAKQSSKLYPATGTSDDWAYGELGIASFTFEMGTTFFQDCSSFETAIWPDNLKALLYAFKIAPAPYRLAYGPDTLSPRITPPGGKRGEPLELTALITDQQNGGRSLQRAEYFILSEHQSNPPGTPGTGLPLDPTDGLWDGPVESVKAVIDTANLVPGNYLVALRGQDADGNWGPLTATSLRIRYDHQLFFPIFLN
jgi:carboxypeptidase T